MQIDERRIAVFIDFENVAMGVRESRYGNFDIDLVLKRLVEKGKIMVKRAYSDWHRYAEFKRTFHQAAIELIDVPQSRYSGKNSADIRMVVDALDLSYQRDHIDTFVLVSGDSDFSPLVSKLRENGRYVIGMGVKQSSSDLLINNCDEFIFYEDLVRPSTESPTLAPKLNHLPRKKAEALRLVVETFLALQREGKEVIYGSMIKQTLVRKLPSFNESYFGYPSFSRLLEDAAENKLLKLTKEQKSGGYIVTIAGEFAGVELSAPDPGESTPAGELTPPPTRAGSTPARTRQNRSRQRWTQDKSGRGAERLVEFPQAQPQDESGTEEALPATSGPAAGLAPPEAVGTEPPGEPSPREKAPRRPRRRYTRSRSSRGQPTSLGKELDAARIAEASAAEPAESSEGPSPTATETKEEAAPATDSPVDKAASKAVRGSGRSRTEKSSAKAPSTRKRTSRSKTVARKPRQPPTSPAKDSTE